LVFIRNYNLSHQLINTILDQLDCRITFIGPVENDFLKNIKQLDRIDLKGVLTGQDLMDEVNKFDVAIAPYVEKKLNEGAFPNKLLIYLALGKPVVVSDLESLKQIELPDNMIYLVKQTEDFPRIIMQAHSGNTSEYILKRIKYSKENTWDIRIDQFLKILKSLEN
jgi:teichuronic acid biosynthesis glycosyltransferase TuaH